MGVSSNEPISSNTAQPARATPSAPHGWVVLQVFVSWRMAVVLLTGFSSGLPLALTGGTLAAWLKDSKVDLTLIGQFTAVGWPYALKFLWSPLMDRFVPPLLGRRRGWIVLTQVALLAGIAAMALTGTASVGAMWVVAMLVAFFSASQDIAIDAYRTDVLRPDELSAGAAIYTLGYRLGMVMSMSVALILADHLSWRAVYLLMGASLLPVMVATLAAPEPAGEARRPRTLTDAIVLPFREFLGRRGAIEMLVFILIYKLDWAMVWAMTTPFMMDIGFTKSEIGAVTQGVGIFGMIGGAVIGGAIVARIGIRRALWMFGLLQGLAGLSFTALAVVGKSHWMMVAAVVIENTCTGMATAAFVGFIMSLCNKRFTATQMALLTSLQALTRSVAGLPAGWLIKSSGRWVHDVAVWVGWARADVSAGWVTLRFGWPAYFVVATLVAIPGLLLLLRFGRWQDGSPAQPNPAGSGARS